MRINTRCTLFLLFKLAIIEALHVNKVPVNKETLLQMLNKCSFVHGNLVKEAAMGQGFDRHLFALQWLAQKSGKMPNIFIHPLHQCFNHYIISTSTLSSDYVMLGAFGPVVPDGFGIGYSLWDDRLGCIVSSYKNGADGSGYINCLKDALNVLYKSILLTAERSVTLRVLMPVDSVVQQN